MRWASLKLGGGIPKILKTALKIKRIIKTNYMICLGFRFKFLDMFLYAKLAEGVSLSCFTPYLH